MTVESAYALKQDVGWAEICDQEVGVDVQGLLQGLRPDDYKTPRSPVFPQLLF